MRLRPRTKGLRCFCPLRVRLLFLCAMCVCVVLRGTRPARAQAPEEAHFTAGAGQCPDPAAVEREVLSLVPPERHELLERGVRIDIDDLGESYRVTVSKDGSSTKKSYADPARDCDGRAR